MCHLIFIRKAVIISDVAQQNEVSLTSLVGTKHYARLHEPPCTDPYARWCRRAKVVRRSLILLFKAGF
jgi:hypothetical protein